MYKAKQRFTTLLLACFAVLVSMLLAVTLWTTPTNIASAADPTIAATFALGANGSASHADGNSKTTYSETNNGYTLNLTGATNMYTGARDAKGNSCIKLGSSSKTGGFKFTVSDDIVQVIIYIGKYKSNTTKVSINGTTSTLTKNSNDGAYDAITVDTSSTKTVTLTTASGGVRAMVNTIEFYIQNNAPACTHESTTWVTENGKHHKECTACQEIIEAAVDCTYENFTYTPNGDGTHTQKGTCTVCLTEAIITANEICSGSNWGEYSTTDGKHSRIGSCTVCNGEVTESGDCEVTAEYVREGNQHTQTGTCSICNASTSVTEDCTLTIDRYEAHGTDNKDEQQHAVTTTCSVCEKSATSNEACLFNEGVLSGSTLTYTCEHCEYSYDEEVTTYTVTYVVPDTVTAIDTVTVAAGFETTLPTAETPDDYTFVGWTTVNLGQETTSAPDYKTAGTQYTVEEDITFYALYSYVEESSTWTIVKDINSLSVNKKIVIVASGSNYALGTNQASNNRTAVTVTKSGDTVTIGETVQIITLEAGSTANTWAFHVTGGTGTNAANGYLYAPANGNYLRTTASITANASWNISISDSGIATIKANVESGQNWLRKNSSSTLFSCYNSGQNDVSIYMKDSTTYYVTASNTCEHANLDEQSQEATCTEQGYRKVTCLDCGTILIDEEFSATGHTEADSVILEATCSAVGSKNIVCSVCEEIIEENIELPKIPHNYENGKCTNCGELLPLEATLTFDDVAKRTSFSTEQQVWMENSIILTNDKAKSTSNVANYAAPVRFYKSSTITIAYPNMVKIIFVCNTAAYAGALTDSIGESASADGKTVTVILAEVSNSFTITLGEQVRMDSLTVISSPVINTASVTLREDITLNYYVSIPENIKADVKLIFTMNGENLDVDGVLQQDGRYKFSLELPPQYMADNVQAELHYNELLLDKIENYSIQAYAKSQLSKTDDDNLKSLISDMLHYGAAAQLFKNHNVDNLANENVEGILAATGDVPTSTDFTLEKNTAINNYPAYFTGAGVHFDNVNKIYVKLSTTENVTLTIKDSNGNEVAQEQHGTTVYTGGITVTGFADTYTFVLSHNGVVMQTLTYSINAYAYQMQSNEDMKALVSALYRYGKSAYDYANPNA